MSTTETSSELLGSSRPSALYPRAAREGVVLGAPAALLRSEGALVLVAAVVAYHHLGGSWWLFAAFFLAPDLSMLGYLAGPRVGAACYNLVHTYLAPGALALIGAIDPSVLPAAVIWFAHLGFDRFLGYGLKYPTTFGDTHLGMNGRSARGAP